jgi:predicted nucleic acid-binding protein
MNLVFADTFFWVAGTNPLDGAHDIAIEFSRTGGLIVTTEEVLTEYPNHFAERGTLLRRRAASRVQRILTDAAIRVVPQAASSFEFGLDLYLRRMDKGYSLTDCISMITMRRQGLLEVLTNDAHFEQEGFRALFRERR